MFSLIDIGESKRDNITRFLFNNPPERVRFFPLYIILSILAVIAIPICIIFPVSIFIYSGIVIYALNIFLHYRNHTTVSIQVPSFLYLNKILKCSGTICKIKKLIDELLSGTNSTERLGASIGILKYIEGKRITCLIATHDTELANYLDDTYDYYHFTDNVSSEGLSFDYVLKYGIVKTSNAIKLLEHIGFPESIIDIIKKPY